MLSTPALARSRGGVAGGVAGGDVAAWCFAPNDRAAAEVSLGVSRRSNWSADVPAADPWPVVKSRRRLVVPASPAAVTRSSCATVVASLFTVLATQGTSDRRRGTRPAAVSRGQPSRWKLRSPWSWELVLRSERGACCVVRRSSFLGEKARTAQSRLGAEHAKNTGSKISLWHSRCLLGAFSVGSSG